MAKRFAGSQITRENAKEDDSDDENGTATGQNHTASASVMSRRKIAMPKKKIAASLKSSGFSPPSIQDASTAPSESAFSFIKPTASNETIIPNGNGYIESDKLAKLKALNLQFQDKVSEFLSKDPCADLAPTFDKYRQYMDSITNKIAAVHQGGDEAPSAEPTVESESSSGDEDEKEAIKVEGPQFTLKKNPTISDSVFTFGAKKNDSNNDEDSSSDETEIKGPQFSFNGTVKSDVFKLTKVVPESGEPIEKKHDISDKEGKPSLNFGSVNGNESTSKPAFNFSPSTQTVEKNDTKPLFTFGGSSKDEKKDVKPSFSFGANQGANQGAKENAKPSFSFNASNQFSQDGTTSNPSFSFNKTETKSTTEEKPSSSFTFNSNNNKSDESAEKKFSFGMSTTSTDAKSENKPLFSFSSSNATAAPSFSFGKAGTNTIPSNKVEDNPSNGFKFNLPFAQKPSEPKIAEITETKDDKDKNEAEDVLNSSQQDVSSAVTLQNGEEDEIPLFAQRSKLMIFNPETKAYDSRGVGEMKLLQRKEDKSKVRLLCRSDGMGNILLNTSLVKSFTYNPLTEANENLIKIPVVEAAGKLITYVVKFKQKSDGRQFVKSIEEAKKDM